MSFLNGTDPGLRQTRTPTTDNFAAGVDFTAGSTTQLTLSADPGSEDNVEITFDGIQQHRNTYSVSGAVVTFDAAIGAGVSNVEATFTTTIPAAQPADGSVNTAQLADDAVTLAKMAAGTDGQIITYDASGNPTAVGPGTAGQALLSNGAGAAPSFQTLSGGQWALVDSNEDMSSGSPTSVSFTGLDATDYYAYFVEIYGLRIGAQKIQMQQSFGGTFKTSGYYQSGDVTVSSGGQYNLCVNNQDGSGYGLNGGIWMPRLSVSGAGRQGRTELYNYNTTFTSEKVFTTLLPNGASGSLDGIKLFTSGGGSFASGRVRIYGFLGNGRG